eukprot:387236_1
MRAVAPRQRLISSDVLSQSNRVHRILQQTFGYITFRGSQLQIILNTINNGDSFIHMATGSGKSMCYWIPPIYSNTPAIVISPLISLIQNQMKSLKDKGIQTISLATVTPATDLSEYMVIYATPESLQGNMNVIDKLHKQSGICCIAVDEAHCIEQWGYDFRSDYMKLNVLRARFPDVPLLALTATATPSAQSNIIKILQLGECGHKLLCIKESGNRLNLSYSLQQKVSLEVDLIGNLREIYSDGSTIIYVPTIRQCETIATELNDKSKTTSASAYHAGMPRNKRANIQTKWENDEIQCIVATSAFGMGIDKPNIRTVVHYGLPKSLELYCQQTGRAGRDGCHSECILFYHIDEFTKVNEYSINVSDPKQRQRRFIQQDTMRRFISTRNCRVKFMMNVFGEDIANCLYRCDNCKMKHGMQLSNESQKQLVLTPTSIEWKRKMQHINEQIAELEAFQAKLLKKSETAESHNKRSKSKVNYRANKRRKSPCGGVINISTNTNAERQQRLDMPLCLPHLNTNNYNMPKNDHTINTMKNKVPFQHNISHHAPFATPSWSETMNNTNSNQFNLTLKELAKPESNHSNVDLEKIEEKKKENAHYSIQRNRMDSDVPDMDKTMKNVKWTKYSTLFRRTIVKYFEIRIIKTSSKIEGYYKEMEGDTFHKICKSWILKQKAAFCKNILMTFFQLKDTECGKTRPETMYILGRKMAFSMKNTKLNDVIMEEVRKICDVLESPRHIYVHQDSKKVSNITFLVHESILQHDILSQLQFCHAFELFKDVESFDFFINDIWNLMLTEMKSSKNMTAFDKWYIGITNTWQTCLMSDMKMNRIRMEFDQLYTAHNLTSTVFETFMLSSIEMVKKTIIQQIRLKIIEAMYEAIDEKKSFVVSSAIYGHGGAALCKTRHYYKRYRKGVYLPLLCPLRAEDLQDERIPAVIIEQNRGNMVIMSPNLERIVGIAMYQLKRETFLLLKISTSPNFSVICKNIIQRDDLLVEFCSLYTKEQLGTNRIAIQGIYAHFMDSVLSKSIWSIVRTQEFNKAYVPLRIQEKVKYINKGHTLDTYGRNCVLYIAIYIHCI